MSKVQKITKIATSKQDFDWVADLLCTYFKWRSFDPILATREEPLIGLQEKYTQQGFCFILAPKPAANLAKGGVGLHPLGKKTCEMKRLFVRPDYWGEGLGLILIEALLFEAESMGYSTMMLDSHPKMIQAQKLYKKCGFVETERYNNNPVKGIRFFKRQI